MAGCDELRIVLLGKTGSGKSSTRNTILGRRDFEDSSSPNAATQDCVRQEATLFGQHVTVIDTPGLFDPKKSEKDLKDEIICSLVECAPGPHAFILVLRVDRYTKEESEVVRKIQELFGEKALKHTVILFTFGDQLDEGKTIKDFVDKNDDLKELVRKCDNRLHVIDNRYWKGDGARGVGARGDGAQGVGAQGVGAQGGSAQGVGLEEVLSMINNKTGDVSIEELKREINNLLMKDRQPEQRISTSLCGEEMDQQQVQESGQPPNSRENTGDEEYRSNAFQIKELMKTINNMVVNNKGSFYTNKSLETIALAIEAEVNKITEEMEKAREIIDMSEIRRRARERVRTKTTRLVTGVTCGVLLGVLLGPAVGVSLPVILLAGLLVGATVKIRDLHSQKGAGVRPGISGAVVVGAGISGAGAGILAAEAGSAAAGILAAEAGSSAAVGVAGAEAGVAGAAIGTGAITGIGLGVAAGVLATAGAVGGGVIGAKAAAGADNADQAAKAAAKAVTEEAGNVIKDAWGLTQRLAKPRETPYEQLE